MNNRKLEEEEEEEEKGKNTNKNKIKTRTTDGIWRAFEEFALTHGHKNHWSREHDYMATTTTATMNAGHTTTDDDDDGADDDKEATVRWAWARNMKIPVRRLCFPYQWTNWPLFWFRYFFSSSISCFSLQIAIVFDDVVHTVRLFLLCVSQSSFLCDRSQLFFVQNDFTFATTMTMTTAATLVPVFKSRSRAHSHLFPVFLSPLTISNGLLLYLYVCVCVRRKRRRPLSWRQTIAKGHFIHSC